MSKQSVIQEVEGKLKKIGYNVFCQKLDTSKNVADEYVRIEDEVNSELEELKAKKSTVDHDIKQAKFTREMARSFLVRYAEERGLDKVEGVAVKSINYQPAKTVVETVATRQIKVGTRYQNLEEVSRETLVEMLEGLGVKTREVAEKVEVTKPASVRVMR